MLLSIVKQELKHTAIDRERVLAIHEKHYKQSSLCPNQEIQLTEQGKFL